MEKIKEGRGVAEASWGRGRVRWLQSCNLKYKAEVGFIEKVTFEQIHNGGGGIIVWTSGKYSD